MHPKQTANTLENRKRVLVVEDDPWVRRFMLDVLSDEGYAVSEAADGRTAIRLAEEQLPDLMLLDIAMPEFTGVDVLCHLKSSRHTRGLPVVVVSAFQYVLPASEAASVASVVTKPVDVDILLAVVRRALEPDFLKSPGSGQSVAAAALV
jgi:CheY-like chemotaxis protein